MKRADKNRPYKGKKGRGGLDGDQVIIVSLLLILAMLAMTIHVNSCYWTEMTAREQLYQALFVTKDWD